MQATPTRSDSEEPRSTQISRLEAHIEGLEASKKESDEWWRTALEIATELESPEHRRKLLKMAKGGHETKIQACALNLMTLIGHIHTLQLLPTICTLLCFPIFLNSPWYGSLILMQRMELQQDKTRCEAKVRKTFLLYIG